VARVSVVIPCYNGERFIVQAVQSALGQTYRDLEVIVVDDGSKDGSAALLRAIPDSRVRVVTQANAGVSAARNAGVAVSSADYVAFLDQDDLWFPDKLARQLPIIDTAADLGLVYADCEIATDGDVVVGRVSDRAPLRRGRQFEELIVDTRVPLSTMLMRRAVFDAVGGFRPKFRYVEDLDLLLRVAARHSIDFVDAPLARYRVHAASVTRTLGLEVATRELVELCEEWMARDAARRPGVARALASALYIAGKTAFYDGDAAVGERYLSESLRRHPHPRAWLFARAMRHAPWALLGARSLLRRARGHAAGPGADSR